MASTATPHPATTEHRRRTTTRRQKAALVIGTFTEMLKCYKKGNEQSADCVEMYRHKKISNNC